MSISTEVVHEKLQRAQSECPNFYEHFRRLLQVFEAPSGCPKIDSLLQHKMSFRAPSGCPRFVSEKHQCQNVLKAPTGCPKICDQASDSGEDLRPPVQNPGYDEVTRAILDRTNTNLAWLYYTKNEKLDEAEKLALKAMELNPAKKDIYQDTLDKVRGLKRSQ